MPHTCLCASLADVVSACALARKASAVETMLEAAMLEGAVAVLEGEVLEEALLRRATLGTFQHSLVPRWRMTCDTAPKSRL